MIQKAHQVSKQQLQKLERELLQHSGVNDAQHHVWRNNRRTGNEDWQGTWTGQDSSPQEPASHRSSSSHHWEPAAANATDSWGQWVGDVPAPPADPAPATPAAVTPAGETGSLVPIPLNQFASTMMTMMSQQADTNMQHATIAVVEALAAQQGAEE